MNSVTPAVAQQQLPANILELLQNRGGVDTALTQAQTVAPQAPIGSHPQPEMAAQQLQLPQANAPRTEVLTALNAAQQANPVDQVIAQRLQLEVGDILRQKGNPTNIRAEVIEQPKDVLGAEVTGKAQSKVRGALRTAVIDSLHDMLTNRDNHVQGGQVNARALEHLEQLAQHSDRRVATSALDKVLDLIVGKGWAGAALGNGSTADQLSFTATLKQMAQSAFDRLKTVVPGTAVESVLARGSWKGVNDKQLAELIGLGLKVNAPQTIVALAKNIDQVIPTYGETTPDQLATLVTIETAVKANTSPTDAYAQELLVRLGTIITEKRDLLGVTTQVINNGTAQIQFPPAFSTN